jgi:hypothetical protein
VAIGYDLFSMQMEQPSDHEVDLALRRFDTMLRYLAVVRQMTWTKTQFFLALNVGLLTLTGALAKTPLLGTGWLASHATRIVAFAGVTASILWSAVLGYNAKEVDRCIGVCRDLERTAMGKYVVLKDLHTGRILTSHRVLALLFLVIWLAVIRALMLNVIGR